MPIPLLYFFENIVEIIFPSAAISIAITWIVMNILKKGKE